MSASDYPPAPPELRAAIEAGGFVEPWTPKVGDRVRISSKPECVCPSCGSPHHDRGVIEERIFDVLMKQPWTVVRVADGCRTSCCGVFLPSHRYQVRHGPYSACFAAIELTSLEAPND